MIEFNKRLFLARHGQTNSNKDKAVLGLLDEGLNETGIQQANEIAEKVKNMKIDVLISSPLKRAYKTAEIIAKTIDLPIITMPDFRERAYGIIEGVKKSDIKTEYPQYVTESGKLILENEFSESEPLDKFYDRVINGFAELKEKYPDKNIMVVTHAGILRVAYAYYNDVPIKEVRNIYNPENINCLIENY
jgi:broad specificity phosphatase PhoE